LCARRAAQRVFGLTIINDAEALRRSRTYADIRQVAAEVPTTKVGVTDPGLRLWTADRSLAASLVTSTGAARDVPSTAFGQQADVLRSHVTASQPRVLIRTIVLSLTGILPRGVSTSPNLGDSGQISLDDLPRHFDNLRVWACDDGVVAIKDDVVVFPRTKVRHREAGVVRRWERIETADPTSARAATWLVIVGVEGQGTLLVVARLHEPHSVVGLTSIELPVGAKALEDGEETTLAPGVIAASALVVPRRVGEIRRQN
jgi:hypothetical protein